MADPRRRLVALAAAALLVSGCGGGAPTEAEFTERMRTSVGDLDDALRSAGIDTAAGDELVDDFIECQYDAISDDEELLRSVYEQPGSVASSTELDVKAQRCVDAFTADVTAAADPSAAVPPTTTTTPDTATTVPPVAPPSTPTSGG